MTDQPDKLNESTPTEDPRNRTVTCFRPAIAVLFASPHNERAVLGRCAKTARRCHLRDAALGGGRSRRKRMGIETASGSVRAMMPSCLVDPTRPGDTCDIGRRRMNWTLVAMRIRYNQYFAPQRLSQSCCAWCLACQNGDRWRLTELLMCVCVCACCLRPLEAAGRHCAHQHRTEAPPSLCIVSPPAGTISSSLRRAYASDPHE